MGKIFPLKQHKFCSSGPKLLSAAGLKLNFLCLRPAADIQGKTGF
jgi:hypothetical protein